jgi:chemotaxis signal transduction protein
MAGDAIRGWLMDVGGRWRLAIGADHVVEYLLSPPTHSLPRMPAHCLGVSVWREQLIPVLDLGPVLSEQSPLGERPPRAVVLAYQESPGEPVRHGALVVRSAPVEVWASDDMACPLPEHPAVLRHLARSCFVNREETIPVLDAALLFSTTLAADQTGV